MKKLIIITLFLFPLFPGQGGSKEGDRQAEIKKNIQSNIPTASIYCTSPDPSPSSPVEKNFEVIEGEEVDIEYDKSVLERIL